tara:strand:+ start:655 stop:861 length:207 start_codon:yes stop_codon:yes gene_type:complete
MKKLRNDAYSFEELDTLEKNARKLGDMETMDLIELSRTSKTAKGEKRKEITIDNETARQKRDRLRRGE